MGVGRIFSKGEPVGDFPNFFFRGEPKVVKFVFYPSKMKKQPFFANNFKIQGMARSPCPPSDTHALIEVCGLKSHASRSFIPVFIVTCAKLLNSHV